MLNTKTPIKARIAPWIMLSTLGAIIGLIISIVLEHSAWDLWLSQQFYLGDGAWIVSKKAIVPDLVFYRLPKVLLIVFEILVIATYIQAIYKDNNHTNWLTCQSYLNPAKLDRRTLAYLALSFIITPTLVATLKSVTHVACPAYLTIFGGELPYISMIDAITTKLHAKCFPAAHASAGFALYALAFVPKFAKHRLAIVLAVTVLGFVMGGYKMLIGDHFLSHTLASVCLAWLVSASCAVVMLGSDIKE